MHANAKRDLLHEFQQFLAPHSYGVASFPQAKSFRRAIASAPGRRTRMQIRAAVLRPLLFQIRDAALQRDWSRAWAATRGLASLRDPAAALLAVSLWIRGRHAEPRAGVAA
jgi:hypothetical protein